MLNTNNQELASCNVVSNPDIFFPDDSDREAIALAKKICEGCPIAFDCLETAMADPELRKWGIWGGTTPEERKTMMRNPRTRLRILAETKAISSTVALTMRKVGKTVRSYNDNSPFAR